MPISTASFRSSDSMGCEVIGVDVHFVAVPGLTGPAVAALVMSNTAIAMGTQEKHLRLPAIRTEWPPVAEHHRLPDAPVLVIDMGAVFWLKRAHCSSPI